jgi:hypothetical protein
MLVFAASLLSSAVLADDLAEIKGYHAVATRTIEATPDQIQVVVGNFETWKDWSAWGKAMDPEAQWTYAGAAGAVGHRMTWDGPKVKQGSMTWTATPPAAPYAFDLTFGRSDKVSGQGRLTLTPGAGGTVVTWEMAGKMGPVSRLLFAKKASKVIGADFEKGLTTLEGVVEAQAAAARAQAKAGAEARAKEAEAAAAVAQIEASKKVAAHKGLDAALTEAKAKAAAAKKKDKAAAEAALVAAQAAADKAGAEASAAQSAAEAARKAADAALAAAAAI